MNDTQGEDAGAGLLPCAHCGGDAGTEHGQYGCDTKDGRWWAFCFDCEANTWHYDTEAEAIAAWNRRATPAPASADKGGEAPTLADVLAWLRSRPGASWVATINDIEKATAALAAAKGPRA